MMLAVKLLHCWHNNIQRYGWINVGHFWVRVQMPWKSWILGHFEPIIHRPQLPQCLDWPVWYQGWEKKESRGVHGNQKPYPSTSSSLCMSCFPLLLAKHCVLPALFHVFFPGNIDLLFCYCFLSSGPGLLPHLSLFTTTTCFLVFSWTISDMWSVSSHIAPWVATPCYNWTLVSLRMYYLCL